VIIYCALIVYGNDIQARKIGLKILEECEKNGY